MQFFYQFPQRVERLALVSSGGLGREVSPLLRTRRAAGRSAALSAAAPPASARRAVARAASRCARAARKGVYLQADRARAAAARAAGRARGVPADAALGHRRAAASASARRDRLYLLRDVPTLIVWGERDHTIPIEHGRAAHEAIPDSRFETLPRAAHFPHLEDPAGLAAVLRDFLDTTEPAPIDDADWGPLLSGRARATVRQA